MKIGEIFHHKEHKDHKVHLLISEFGLGVVDFRLQVVGYGSQITGYRLQIADLLSEAKSRLTGGFRIEE